MSWPLGTQGTKAIGMAVDVRKVRIGSVRLFVAPIGTAYSPTGGLFNVDAPQAGWRDLGATMEDTTLEATKNVFSLKTGMLKTTKYQAVIGMDGKITANLQEFNADVVADCMGSAQPFNVLAASPTGAALAPTGSFTTTTFTMATGGGAQFAIGERVVVDALASLTASRNVSWISDIAGEVITVSPALSVAPTPGQYMRKVMARKNAMGTTVITKVALLAVHDFVGGTQYVYHFPEVCAIESGFRPALQEGKENVKLPITFAAYGVTDADFADTVCGLIYEIE
jgi:hypothetical protein